MTNPDIRAGSAWQAASQSFSTPVTGESSSPTDYAEVELGHGRPGHDGTELTLHNGGVFARRSVLPGGVRVITESVPGLCLASTGMWFGVGSRDEVPGQEGSTHFPEHLLFRGTVTHDTRDIAEAFGMISGESNAATLKEHTSYYACVLAPDGMQALNVPADMVTSSLLEPDDVETECGIIVSELADAVDDPADVAQEAFARAAFGEDTPLGRPIGGTGEAIAAVPCDTVWEYYKRTYVSDTLVMVAVGAVGHDEVYERALADLAAAGWDASPDAAPRECRFGAEPFAPLDIHDITVPYESEQSHLYLTCRGIAVCDERRWAMSVLTTILGGGMSSCLLQGVREKWGLAYTTYVLDISYASVGAFGLYVGCAPGSVDEVCAVMIGEFEKLVEHGVTEQEMMCARGRLRGAMVLGGEDPLARMGRLKRVRVVTGRLRSMEDDLCRLEAVTLEEVREMAAQLVEQKHARILVGPVG